MKKFVIFCLICVVFICLPHSKINVTATADEQLNFVYNNKVFCYQLTNNIKKSNIFEFDYAINKYNRFGNKTERQALLHNMLEIGFDKDIIIEYLFPNLKHKLNNIEKNIFESSQNATIKINSNKEKVFTVTNEQLGICVNTKKLYDDICIKYLHNEELTFNIPTSTILPQIYSKDLLVYTHLRADFSTDISSSSADRKHNIKNALTRLNKLEIAPNELFSFNKVIGKRTKENGYREAKIIINNEFVDGLGGGVCQVSSTLYNSALLAGLEIVEANKHSKQVGYVKYGFDAMVNFGSSDLKFRNNTNEKITIITNFSSNNLRIRIFGEDLNNVTYKLTNEIISTTNPIEIIEYDNENKYLDKVTYDDEYFYLKKANKGMEVKSYREKYLNGNLQEKQLLRYDKFKVQNAIKIYGTKKRINLDTLNEG